MTWHHIELKPKKGELPDIEIWQDLLCTLRCRKCGVVEGPEGVVNDADRGVLCPECGKRAKMKTCANDYGYFYWFCVPGCDPDSEPFGPFENEQQALDSARAFVAELD